MGWESFDVVRFDLGPLLHGSLALVSCLFGGYKFASVLRCVGLVFPLILTLLKLFLEFIFFWYGK